MGLLELAANSDFPKSSELVGEVMRVQPSETTAASLRQQGEPWYYHRKAAALQQMLDRVGQPLELSFTGLDGQKVDLKDYRGKVVLLDFWATWCPPCLRELPTIKALAEEHGEAGLVVMGISYDTDRDKLVSFVKENDLSWPQYFSEEGYKAEWVQALGKPGPPAYWLVNREGVLVDVNARKDM